MFFLPQFKQDAPRILIICEQHHSGTRFAVAVRENSRFADPERPVLLRCMMLQSTMALF